MTMKNLKVASPLKRELRPSDLIDGSLWEARRAPRCPTPAGEVIGVWDRGGSVGEIPPRGRSRAGKRLYSRLHDRDAASARDKRGPSAGSQVPYPISGRALSRCCRQGGEAHEAPSPVRSHLISCGCYRRRAGRNGPAQKAGHELERSEDPRWRLRDARGGRCPPGTQEEPCEYPAGGPADRRAQDPLQT